MQTLTSLADLVTTHGVPVDDHHDLDALVPVTDRLQFQGDVAVIPVAAAVQATGSGYPNPVPAAGVAVVRGENGGNTHLLLDGRSPDAAPVTWDPSTGGDTGLDLGVVTVPTGALAYLAHPEHAYSGIAPGRYVIRRQREQADVIRLIAD